MALLVLGCQPADDATGTLAGKVVAGPVCPVVRDPPDPGCADRPVPDATLMIEAAGGGDAVPVTSDEGGLFEIYLPPGDYVLEPQPVDGLMGTAAAQPFQIEANRTIELSVVYDTGIR
ncbi:MAG: carboxypeptidase-like regulatory domain-containing protein [Chloroflexi bacterium]|nr:carboxypeptidase-like regulatory domain-containing protein [Chloroflexota bacterium]